MNSLAKKNTMKKQTSGIEQAVKELQEIIQIRDDKSFKYAKSREEQLLEWLYKWVETVDHQQLVLNPKHLDSEYTDLIKYKLTQNMLEDVSEAGVEYSTTQNSLKASISVFRRKPRT